MPTCLACVAFDADQPQSIARFWAELLGWSVTVDRSEHVDVAAPDADGPELALAFLPARRAKSGKNRVHLDLATRSLDHQRTQVDRALSLGARRVNIGQGCVPWTVLADPEGNEFCVIEPREEYVDTGALAAVVIDTSDPVRLAEFWSTATGWPVVHHSAGSAGLRSPTGLGSWLELVATADSGFGHTRLRLDLTSFPTEDRAIEVARLHAAGATTLGPDPAAEPDSDLVLADPDSNEFRLLAPARFWSNA
ncbi:VOC family protein [Nocardia sp. CNY236]|uniref:VOC family protein n=1 Tax=Nocardia sp. CNY236 TaxID=1169152 RepID=UPI0004035D67|nr:VOC family protein [Nocardia sp. CNY236]